MTLQDKFDEPFSDEERAEVAAMPSHEVYLLTKMIPHGTVRAREVNEIYSGVMRREREAGLGV